MAGHASCMPLPAYIGIYIVLCMQAFFCRPGSSLVLKALVPLQGTCQSVSQPALALAAESCQQRQQIVDTNAAVSGEVGAGRADSDHRCVVTNAVC